VYALMAGAYPNLGRADQAVVYGEQARESLEKPAALFRDMGMRLWSDRVDAEVRLLPG